MNGGSGATMWNQVLLDGKWYNCCLTNAADYIKAGKASPYFLQSNDDFGGHGENHRYAGEFCPWYPEQVQQADTSINDEEQVELLKAVREFIVHQKKYEEEQKKAAMNESLQSGSEKKKSLGEKLKELLRIRRDKRVLDKWERDLDKKEKRQKRSDHGES